jgi:MFS family permease
VLAAGIAGRNAATVLFASFSTISLVTFLNFANPYLFALLEIPLERQGALAGFLVSLQEAVQIAICTVLGAWADRRGRRPIFVGGLLLMACSFVVYPMAPGESALVLLRALYSVGSTTSTVMLSICLAEYIHESTRGRWMGTIGVCNGIGVVLMATVFAKLPLAFRGMGYDETTALRASFWVFAACVALLAALLRWGLAPPAPVPQAAGRASLWRQTLAGLTVARDNPRIALSYFMAFASRGDLVILTTFISLWVVQAGSTSGLGLAQATARAGMVFGIAQGVALLWSFAMGMILDRVPRLPGVTFGFALAAVGYATLGFVDDPLGRGMIYAAMLAGIGEASAVVCAGVLIGQEAPAAIRGTVIGTYSLAGSLGMICLTFLGGQLFDAIAPSAPFAMMGVVNFAVFVAGALLIWHEKAARRVPVRAAPQRYE